MNIFHTSGLLGKTNVTGKTHWRKCVFSWNESLLPFGRVVDEVAFVNLGYRFLSYVTQFQR